MNFFYPITVNDRFRFPILLNKDKEKEKEKEKENRCNIETPAKVPSIEDDNTPNYVELFKVSSPQKEGYFEVFKKENQITNCEKGIFCDDILKFLDKFFKKMKDIRNWRSLLDFSEDFNNYVIDHSSDLHELMEIMNVKKLITPCFEVEAPIKVIEEYNHLEEDERYKFQSNSEWSTGLREFGFFLDRYESTKEVLCLFVWSAIDYDVFPLPAVGLNPYPLCWECDKGFGTMSCDDCHVAKYCSKECRMSHYIRHSGPSCDLMASSLRKVKEMCFKDEKEDLVPNGK